MKTNWFEVYRDDEEEVTETIATFDTKKQALDFIYDYSMRYPETELGYDEWESITEDGEVQSYKKQ